MLATDELLRTQLHLAPPTASVGNIAMRLLTLESLVAPAHKVTSDLTTSG
jgi:hypothetical protein